MFVRGAIVVLSSENSKRRGDIAEAYIIARLLEVGYYILKPVGDNCRYDLVIEDNEGHLWKVQCKLGWIDKRYSGCFIFATVSSYAHTRAGQRAGYGSRGYVGEIDYFAVYCKETKGVYLIPIQDAPTARMCLRFNATRNGQTKGIRWAKDYEL